MHSPLIIALDFDEEKKAMYWVELLDPSKIALKVGLELFTRCGPSLVRTLVSRGFKVFLDLKFHDIPNTVAKACKAAADLGVWMLNVHISGGLTMLAAAKKALDGYGQKRPLLIGVTILTSVNDHELLRVGISDSLDKQVIRLALLAKEALLDGIVCSAQEVISIKESCGNSFLCVTPGIRLPGQSADDQSRLATPKFALSAGSDYLVLGRSITQSNDPKNMLEQLLHDMKI